MTSCFVKPQLITRSARILLVTGDEQLALSFKGKLDRAGYRVQLSETGSHSLSVAQRWSPDLSIVDWAVSDMTGLDLCRQFCSAIVTVPVVLLTEPGQVGDRVQGLNIGASDCLEKSIHPLELQARIRARLRRNRDWRSGILSYDDLILNRATRQVFRDDREIQLTTREFDLLDYLLRHARQVKTRHQILEHVWGYEFAGESNIIEVYIRSLRLKLEKQQECRLIHTVRSVGYVLRSVES